jgi:tetratricopeptide (TPR) repeat protein
MRIRKYLIFTLLLFNITFLFSENAVDFLKKGKASYFDEKYEDAIYFYKKALEINPNYSDAFVELSHIYYELELYDYAYKYIQSAIKLSTNTDTLLLYSADIETKLTIYDAAEKKYTAILKNNPLNIEAQNGLANLYLLNYKYTLAKKILDDALKIDPNNFRAIYLTAKYYEGINSIKNADKYYLYNIERNSLNPDSFFYYSIFNFNSRKNSDALEIIKSAIKIKNKTIYQKYYGKCLLHANNGKEALAIFMDILKKDKDNYLNYYNLANAYFILNDYDNAIKQLEMALRLRDDDEISLYMLNSILSEKYDTDNNARKDKSNSFYSKAMKAKKESLFDSYLFYLKESIRLYPKNVNARIELANYFLNENLSERYLRELQLAYKYSSDKNLNERIQIEQKRITYRLGDDWNIEQYLVKNDIFTIPLFIIKDINNTHFNVENTFADVFKNIFLKDIKYDLKKYSDKDYSPQDKMILSRDNNSPFYIDLKIKEMNTNIEVNLYLMNAVNNVVIKHYFSIKNGNDKIVKTAYNLQSKLNNAMLLKHIF